MMQVSQTSLVAYHRVSGIDALDLSSLDLVRNSNLISNNMAYLRHQGITVDDDNNPEPENIPDKFPQQLVWGENQKETFSQGDLKMYTTTMRLSKIILVKR